MNWRPLPLCTDAPLWQSVCHLYLPQRGITVPNFCVNRNAQSGSGDHEVHDLASTQGCLPAPANRVDLGSHATCRGAVAEAKKHFSDVNGCRWCATECHTT